MESPVAGDIVPITTVSRFPSLDIIPATLKSIKELGLSQKQLYILLIGGMVCGTITTLFYISKKKDSGADCTIGSKIKQDKQTKTKVNNVTVNKTEGSRSGNSIGLEADVTDEAELNIDSINLKV